MKTLETDYLIVGSGAVGMAFADTLLSETENDIIIVDRYAKPGGHWNVAYPFVTLHQPSQFYGVSSKELSKGRKDEVGLNKGLNDLATGAEVSAYFDDVMRHTFLPSGRVRYFPLCDYKENNQFECLISGVKYKVKVNKKLVNATYLNTSVPSTHTPSFTISEGVTFMPLNDLVKINNAPEGFVIVGGGKTGIDAILWLLEYRVDPDKITWIVSRDAWLIDRQNTQPDEEFFEPTIGAQAAQFEAVAQATSIDDMFDRLEDAGVLVRIDKSVRPQMFHGATISQMELKELQRIKNVVRLGRVRKIEKDEIVLDKGTIPTSPNKVHVDCSASAISNLKMKTIFEDGVITPQTVRPYQPVFSAAFIAHVEASYEDDKTKNKICQVVPLPNHDTDWIRMMAAQMINQFTWSQDKGLRHWLRNNRLDGFSGMVKNVDKTDAKKMAILQRMRDNAMPAMMKMQQFITELDASNQPSMERPQMQVKRDAFFKNRLVETPSSELELKEDEVLVRIEKFAYTSNNITYAVAGDMLKYWHFFPPTGNDNIAWGVIPVWGFAEIVESKVEGLPVGDRLFGYFPPAKFLKMSPIRVTEKRFIDGAEHRANLPTLYNLYRRVNNESGYNPAFDRERMLLFPLHLTSFCLWNALQEKAYNGAKQVLVLSASSKTSTGLGYALKADENAPRVIGVTSKRNLEMVNKLDLYDECINYENVTSIDANTPTVIVDMSGNAKVLVALHNHLSDQMKLTLNVGVTHWTNAQPQKGIIKERSEFFFAPSHIQKILKEWGPADFDQKSSAFLKDAAAQTKKWLTFKKINGLKELAAIHPEVCNGKIPADQGLIVEL